MPPHWLAPTVTGARLPNPRPQIAVSPSRFAQSKSTPPGGAAKSTMSADLLSRDNTFSPTTRVGTVEKSKSRRKSQYAHSFYLIPRSRPHPHPTPPPRPRSPPQNVHPRPPRSG